MRKINKIIVHCSDSEWGTMKDIKEWHTLSLPKGRGWSHIGYHYIICNGYPTYNSYKDKRFDLNYCGLTQIALDDQTEGIHCAGDNKTSIGICLIGVKTFPQESLQALNVLLINLLLKYNLKPSDIYGHYERPSGIKQGKTCPNFNCENLRKMLIVKFLNSFEEENKSDPVIG